MSKTQNRVIAGLATVIVSIGVLTACGSGVPAGQVSGGDTIKEQVFMYNGADLHCVSMYPDANAYVMSCDWVRYHAENPLP